MFADIRLSGSINVYEGRVQILYNGEWARIAGQVDNSAAKVSKTAPSYYSLTGT